MFTCDGAVDQLSSSADVDDLTPVDATDGSTDARQFSDPTRAGIEPSSNDRRRDPRVAELTDGSDIAIVQRAVGSKQRTVEVDGKKTIGQPA